jgi:mevalonate pyrophosphate decarboxylase
MKKLALPGVEYDLNGTTLMLNGDVSPEDLEKVKKAIDDLGFGCKEKSA